jgi:hypothetical protein
MTSIQITILSILACFGLTSIGALAGLIFYNTPISNIQPVMPISYPTSIPSTRTPRPSPTLSIFTGEPRNYLPTLPDRFVIDYSIQEIDETLEDGSKLFSVSFIDMEASTNSNVVMVFYFIYMYPSESSAISKYQKYASELKAEGEGTLETDVKLIDGVDDSLVYIVEQSNLTGECTSRIKNVILTTVGVMTPYDPQTITEAFMKSFMEDIAEVHMFGILELFK